MWKEFKKLIMPILSLVVERLDFSNWFIALEATRCPHCTSMLEIEE